MVTDSVIWSSLKFMKDLCFLSATEIAKGIQSGDIKSEQVLESLATRIEEFEKTVKAWEYWDKDFILHKAVKQMIIKI